MQAACYRIVGYFLVASKPSAELRMNGSAEKALLTRFVKAQWGKPTWPARNSAVLLIY
jgi:hypothetical protein